jgi:small subunit ribosomal protein S7
MARRKAAAKRVILPDPLFESELVAKFINVVMRRGKKSIAEKNVYGALDKLVEHYNAKAKKASEADKAEKAEKEKGSADKGKDKVGGIRASATARKVALELFEKMLDVVRPTVAVKARRVGGANYQVPVEVNEEHGVALAMRWVVECAKSRGEKSMVLRLAGELVDALDGKGGAIKKREDTHKMAKANQAFAHYRW